MIKVLTEEWYRENFKFCGLCGSEMVPHDREPSYDRATGEKRPYSHWVCKLTINQLGWAVDNHDIIRSYG